jgi:uncharacterized protein (TIGR02246 family)
MKAFFPCAITLLVTVNATCISAQMDTGQGAETEIRRLSNEEVQAFLRNDPNTMARLWSDGLIVTNPLNKLVSKQDVLGMVNSGFLVITSYDRRIEYARVYGNMVILAGSETVVWGGKMPVAGKTQELRFTAIWMKQEGRWQEVARHANIVPQPVMSQAEREPNSGPIPSAIVR